MCNHYKRANNLETFRRYIAEIPKKLQENYIYKVGVAYGNVIENEKPIVFHFEDKNVKNVPIIVDVNGKEIKEGMCVDVTYTNGGGFGGLIYKQHGELGFIFGDMP